MQLDILCEVTFPDAEDQQISEAAKRLGLTRDEVIRAAVKNFSAECVPTQGNGQAHAA